MKSLRSYEIVQYVQERKYCSLPELMEKFQVSSATIHRDVAALVKAGQVRKVHGGVAAVRVTGTNDAPENPQVEGLQQGEEDAHTQFSADETSQPDE